MGLDSQGASIICLFETLAHGWLGVSPYNYTASYKLEISSSLDCMKLN